MERAAVPRRLRWWLGNVVEVVRETPTVCSLKLDVPDWRGHYPGQHVDVRLTADDGYQAVRSYSIASSPEANLLMLTVERLEDGEVSAYLTDELRPGDQLEFYGPIGGFFIWTLQMGGPLQLLAGGSGIAPLMAMIRHRVATGSQVPIRLLYSSSSEDEVIYRDELSRLARHCGNLQVIHTFTQQRPPGWTGYTRRIDHEMLREVVWPPEANPLIYVCGSTGFVESVSDVLLDLGYDAASVRTERFGATGE